MNDSKMAALESILKGSKVDQVISRILDEYVSSFPKLDTKLVKCTYLMNDLILDSRDVLKQAELIQAGGDITELKWVFLSMFTAISKYMQITEMDLDSIFMSVEEADKLAEAKPNEHNFTH